MKSKQSLNRISKMFGLLSATSFYCYSPFPPTTIMCVYFTNFIGEVFHKDLIDVESNWGHRGADMDMWPDISTLLPFYDFVYEIKKDNLFHSKTVLYLHSNLGPNRGLFNSLELSDWKNLQVRRENICSYYYNYERNPQTKYSIKSIVSIGLSTTSYLWCMYCQRKEKGSPIPSSKDFTNTKEMLDFLRYMSHVNYWLVSVVL